MKDGVQVPSASEEDDGLLDGADWCARSLRVLAASVLGAFHRHLAAPESIR